MSNIQSYNALIDRFKAFASGHYILKAFSHGQINEADLAKFSLYPFMHVVPADVTYDRGTKLFSFQIILADLPRDKEDKIEYQKEVLSDLQRIAEDLIAEITNHRMLFGELITCQNVSIQPFLEEFHHTLTGWTVSIDLLVPYYWDACSIPAEWNDMFESSTGGTGTILSFEDSIVRDENGIVTLVNDEANPSPNYYYGTNSEGVRGWYLITDEVGLTCQTIGSCQTIIDIEAAIDLLQTDVTNLQTDVALKANTADISAVGFSNDYNDLDNLPTIPAAQVNSDWNATSGVAQILNKPSIPAGGLPAGGTAGQILTKVDSTDYNATWQENFADWTSVVKHTVKNNGTQTLDKGKAVYITTSNGTNMLVGYASNNTEATSSKTIGLLQSTLTTTGTNSTGFVITEGLLGGLNTQGTTAGDPIWLGVDGALIYGLANKPYAPAHLVFIGIVTKVSAGNGEIFVKVQNGFELKELHDVDLVTTTPVNGNVLGFDGTLWVNKTIAGWLGFTPVTNARTLTINGTAYDLSADRSWTIASNPGTVTSVSALTIGTSGTDLSSTVANSTSTPVITLNVPTASATNRGALSSTDWSTFNGKFTLPSLTSGSVLFSNGTTIAQSNSQLFWDNVNNRLGIGTATPSYRFHMTGGQAFLKPTNNSDDALSISNQGFITFRDTSDVITARLRAAVSQFQFQDASFNIKSLISLNNGVTYFNNGGGNVLIGTTTDAGYKLDVNGTSRFSGIARYQNTSSNWLNIDGSASGTNHCVISNRFNQIQISTNTGGTAPHIALLPATGGSVSIGTSAPDASAFVQINSTTQGFLPPRMTTTQKNAIASPAAGLVVYDTTLGKLCVRTAAAWETITSV